MENQRNDEKEGELPHDIITEMILTRLPIKSILRFKSVSKLWYSTLSSPRFALTHSKFSHLLPTESLLIRSDKRFEFLTYENGEIIDLVDFEVDFDVGHEKMDLVGTCNGLVCFGSSSARLCIVWNPITHEFNKYFDSEITDAFTARCIVYWGFGYVSTVDDYKIVRLCKNMDNYSLTLHVYSTKVDKWKIINNNAFDDTSHLTNPVLIRVSGVLANETLYWTLPGTNVSYDLMSEKLDTFRHLEVSTPAFCMSTNDEAYGKLLFVVNGCISMHGQFFMGVDMLIIRKSREVIERIVVPGDLAWSMHYGGDLIGFTRSDKIFTNYMSCLGIMDLTQRPLKIILLMNLIDRRGKIEIVSYRATLISPHLRVIRTLQDSPQI